MKKSIVCIVCCLFLVSCMSSQKMKRVESFSVDKAIDMAIANFSKHCSLFKHDSIFRITIRDTVRQLKFEIIDNHHAKWVRDISFPDLFLVSIMGEHHQEIWYHSDVTIGSKGRLPSRYKIVKGKLFYWKDDSYPLTEETLSVFIKYNALTEMIDVDKSYFPDEIYSDDSKKEADYYFCRNNLSLYKRVVTNISFGYYKVPKVKCR